MVSLTPSQDSYPASSPALQITTKRKPSVAWIKQSRICSVRVMRLKHCPKKPSKPPKPLWHVKATSTTSGSRRSEEHTSELQSLMRISYAVFCLKKKKKHKRRTSTKTTNNKT